MTRAIEIRIRQLVDEAFRRQGLERARLGPQLVRPATLRQFEKVRRFEMTPELKLGGGGTIRSADATRLMWTGDAYEDDDQFVFEVFDAGQAHCKMATAAGDAGAMGWAVQSSDRKDWEILTMQTPGTLYGTARDDFSPSWATVDINVLGVFWGYNVFQGGYGNIETVDNQARRIGWPTAGYNFSGPAGCLVIARYVHAIGAVGAYEIEYVEPNDYGWLLFENVAHDLFVDGGGHVTSYSQSDIKVPWWTTID